MWYTNTARSCFTRGRASRSSLVAVAVVVGDGGEGRLRRGMYRGDSAGKGVVCGDYNILFLEDEGGEYD